MLRGLSGQHASGVVACHYAKLWGHTPTVGKSADLSAVSSQV